MPRPAYYCQYSNCSTTSLTPGRRLYRFPKEEERCEKWISATRNPRLKGKPAVFHYKNSRLCDNHFAYWCFMNAQDRSRLVFNAVPDTETKPSIPEQKVPETLILPDTSVPPVSSISFILPVIKTEPPSQLDSSNNGSNEILNTPATSKQIPFLEAGTATISKQTPFLEAGATTISKRTPFLEAGTTTISKQTPFLEVGTAISKKAPFLEAGTATISKQTPFLEAGATTISKRTPFLEAGTTTISKQTPFLEVGTAISKKAPFLEAGTATISKQTPFLEVGAVATSKQTPYLEASTSPTSKQTPSLEAQKFAAKRAQMAKIIKRKNDALRKLKIRVHQLKQSLAAFKKPKMHLLRWILQEEGVSEYLTNFIVRQVKLCSAKYQSRRFSSQEKTFAYNVLCESRTAYKVLKNLIELPSEATLKRFMSSVNSNLEIAEM